MSKPLRLMTFNVQLLPLIAGVLDGTVNVPDGIIGLFPKDSGDSVARALAVSQDLLTIPPVDRPHIIGLNEVFSEDGRKVLLTQLKKTWPYVIESVHEGDLEDDAGLMVFSSLPFRVLPGGGNRSELFYSADAGADSWASKAAVLVQVDAPVDETTLVFTHLQASYIDESEYRDVRDKQMIELVQWIDEFFGHDPGKWRNLILAGDLNFRGDVGQSTGEWFDIFDRIGHPFGDRFVDSWIEMRPPMTKSDHDSGLTHRDRPTGNRMRLDYLCRVKPKDAEQLVAHHVGIGHRNVSDHFALEGLFQLRDPHSQPCTATDINTMGPVIGLPESNPSTSRIFVISLEINKPGSLHWIWISHPGTYTFNTHASLIYHVYADSDLSTPLARIDQLSITELPPELQSIYGQFDQSIDPVGSTFVSRSALLVAVQHRHQHPSSGKFFVLEHQGDSQATAILLPPHLDVTVPFPSSQRLGTDDVAWFRIMPSATLMSKPRIETVILTNPPGRSSTLDILDRGLTKVVPSIVGPESLVHTFSATIDDDFYLTIHRDRDDSIGHTVRWSTPVTYLLLDEGFTIHVNDETGTDFAGADEPELKISLDGEPFVTATWDDADTDEDWPGLADHLRLTAVKRGWTSPSIAFSEGLSIEIVEPDSPLGMAHGVTSHEINVLSPTEPAGSQSMTIIVYDTISDGTYTVSCVLSHDP